MIPASGNIAPLIDAARVAVEAFDTLRGQSQHAAHQAAKAIIAALDSGATQTQIAASIKKSQAWVSTMAKWHRDGGTDELLPFAASSQLARERREAKLLVTNNPPATPAPTPAPEKIAGAVVTNLPVKTQVTKVERAAPIPVLVPRAEGDPTPPTKSELALREFKFACDTYLPRMDSGERAAAVQYVLTNSKLQVRAAS